LTNFPPEWFQTHKDIMGDLLREKEDKLDKIELKITIKDKEYSQWVCIEHYTTDIASIMEATIPQLKLAVMKKLEVEDENQNSNG